MCDLNFAHDLAFDFENLRVDPLIRDNMTAKFDQCSLYGFGLHYGQVSILTLTFNLKNDRAHLLIVCAEFDRKTFN